MSHPAPHQHHGPASHAHSSPHDHASHDATVLGVNIELFFALAAGGLLIAGWALGHFALVSHGITVALFVMSGLLGGWFAMGEVIQQLRQGKLDIDLLMIVAALGAASLGKWAEGALLLFLFSLGHALEHHALGRARRAIEALAELAPTSAHVRRDDAVIEVPVAELAVGDVVVVRPNERLAADGYVVAGESAVDQAPVTGESIPVDKRPVPDLAHANQAVTLDPAHRVFTGTLNGNGALDVYVTRLSSENTLAKVVQLVAQAEDQKSPTQLFADRFQRVFVPAVLGFVLFLLFAPLVLNESFGESFYRAMAVLVASSPCALAISTPAAVLSGVARAGRSGVLIKGGAPLEHLGNLTAIAFDKTGTLTHGNPKLTDIRPAHGVQDTELLRITAAVEALSEHPLARAVNRDARKQLGENVAIPSAENLKSLTGQGLTATVEGKQVHVGNANLFGDNQGDTQSKTQGPFLPDALRHDIDQLEASGRTTMIVRHGERYLGVLGLMDTPRQQAAHVIEKLKKLGITQTLMLSGDNPRAAQAVAQAVGIDQAMGSLMPEDKVAAIAQLREQHARVAMVGDGVNDAPAMARATVGIAMGAAGSDVALETADVALMADDLEKLPFAVGLSRASARIIRQNLWISLGMIAFLVPATLLGLPIGPAVVLHEGSTLVVVFNALRLLAYPGD
ncbi:MAG: heavy metal translocating P-type ATPase [Algisphaera sp.]